MYPVSAGVLGHGCHGAEVGEQEVDCVRVSLFGFQPTCVAPLPTKPVQRLPAEVVLLRVERAAMQGAVVRAAQEPGDVSVTPELSDVVGGLRRAVCAELVAA